MAVTRRARVPIISRRCPDEPPSAAPSARRWSATATCSICGASFAGLAVARELAGSGADVLVIDRYEIGERQTSACGIPTAWLTALGPAGVAAADVRRARHPHPAHARSRYDLPWTFSTFDYRTLCGAARRPGRLRRSRRPRSSAATGNTVAHRPRRDPRPADRRRARLAAGARAPATTSSPPTRCSPAGSRSIRSAPARDLEVWIDRGYVPPATAGAFPAGDELRIGVGSFDPRFHVKEPTVRLAEDLQRRHGPLPGQLDPPRAARRRPRTASSSPATRPATACR